MQLKSTGSVPFILEAPLAADHIRWMVFYDKKDISGVGVLFF